MFFIASKVFWLVAQPLSVILLLLVGALLAIWLKRPRWAVTGMALAAVVLALSGYTSLGYQLIRPLENRFTLPVAMPEQVGAILVLGGSTLARVSTVREVAEMNEAGDRLTTALSLAQRYPEAPVIMSGGTGLFDGGTESEAATAERLLLGLGLEPERLRLETEARNTDENAAFTREMLASINGPVLLVTSAFHMPRSVGLFRQQGLEVLPWPTDYRGSGEEGFGFDFGNPVRNLDVTSIAVREWIGLIAYYLTGRTEELLPAQTASSSPGISSR